MRHAHILEPDRRFLVSKSRAHHAGTGELVVGRRKDIVRLWQVMGSVGAVANATRIQIFTDLNMEGEAALYPVDIGTVGRNAGGRHGGAW